MFRAVFPVFLQVPVEMGFGHESMVSGTHPISHTFVWLTTGAPFGATSNVAVEARRARRAAPLRVRRTQTAGRRHLSNGDPGSGDRSH